MKNLDEAYWDNRYKQYTDAWDLGEVSPPIKDYFDQMQDKTLDILIPGGGNSYEAEYLYNSGFQNVYVVDLSQTVLQNIKNRFPKFPDTQLIHGDFFDLDRTFDMIVEQTFFCALNPNLRTRYVEKMHELLKANSKLVGLLFELPVDKEGPPFGGNKMIYIDLFASFFDIQIMTGCYNSVDSRLGKELFFKVVKK